MSISTEERDSIATKLRSRFNQQDSWLLYYSEQKICVPVSKLYEMQAEIDKLKSIAAREEQV